MSLGSGPAAFHEAGVLERALVEYQLVVQLDPTNQYAQVELEKVREEIARARGGDGAAPTLDEMKKRTRDMAEQPPMLNPRSQERISLDFPEPQSLFAIYQALSKAFGINVLFDPQLRDQEMTIELRNVTAQSAHETLMRAAGHFYKVIDEQTILIAQDTQQNRRTYEDLVIQTFYLSNAEVKDAVQLLRGLIASRNLSANEQLNAVTIRDTADKVKIAQRILETIDKSRSEVVHADLRPGVQLEESVLNVKVEEKTPFYAWFAFNNYQSPSVGAEQGILTLSHQT